MKFTAILFLLLFSTIVVKASRVDTLLVKSNSMDKEIPNIIVIPDSYDTSVEKFPVLYLLHGAYGDYTNWTSRAPQLKDLADLYQMIIVCPDGGSTSWYFDSPIDDHIKYETYVSKELVTSIDESYKTVASKDGRAITGLSMGGHGALYLSIKNQEIWGAAGSMSGGVDIRPFPLNWDLSKRLGSYTDYPKNWEENTVINMIYKLHSESLRMIIDCGTSDFFFDGNQRLHAKLLERNIPHDYIERPGNHDWDYWSNSINFQLLFFHAFFEEGKA